MSSKTQLEIHDKAQVSESELARVMPRYCWSEASISRIPELLSKARDQSQEHLIVDYCPNRYWWSSTFISRDFVAALQRAGYQPRHAEEVTKTPYPGFEKLGITTETRRSCLVLTLSENP